MQEPREARPAAQESRAALSAGAPARETGEADSAMEEHAEARPVWTRWWVVVPAALALTVGLLGLLWPTLAAPLLADERYQYLWVPSVMEGSWSQLVPFTWEEISRRVDDGRIVPFGFLVQRIAYLGGTGFAVATGSSIVLSHALVKLAMFALAVLSAYALLRRIRVRRRGDDVARGLAPTTVRVCTLLFTVLLAAGVQTQVPHRSSWVTYPVLTWGAVTVFLGTTWAVLRLTDAVAKNAAWWFLAAPVLLFLGLFLNTSYELFYVAVPLALLTLAMHSPPGATTRARWVPKVLTAAVFGGSFLVVFVWLRRYIDSVCAVQECYVGAVPDLGLQALRTGALNLLSSVPGFGRTEAMSSIESAGAPAPVDLAGPFAGWGWLVALLTIAATLVLLRSLTAGAAQAPQGQQPVETAGGGETATLWVVAGFGVAMAAGAALVMGLSEQAQEEVVTSLGVPYRNTVSTWAGISLTLAAASLLVARRFPRTANLAPVAVVSVVVLWAGVVIWPVNAQVIDATRTASANEAIAWMYDVVTRPDLDDEAARCQTLEEAVPRLEFETGRTVVNRAKDAFEIYWERPLCSTAPDPE